MKYTTGSDVREPRSEKLTLEIALKVSRKLKTGNLFWQNTLKQPFARNAAHRRHSLLRCRKSPLITHSLIQAPSTLMRGKFYSIRKEKQKAQFFFLNSIICKFSNEKFTYLYSTFNLQLSSLYVYTSSKIHDSSRL